MFLGILAPSISESLGEWGQPAMSRKINVLLVDDMEPPVRELTRALRVYDSGDYEFEVVSALDVRNYLRIVEEKEFDVLVVDIRLAIGEEGIDTILAYHHRRWPSTIIVVYSAFPGMDKVATCVRAIKLGASDVVDKGSNHPVQSVVDAIVNELNHQFTDESGPTSDWLSDHFGELQDQYGGKAVAFVGNQVVRSASSVMELRKELATHPTAGVPYLLLVPTREHAP
jgi:ActR/RegA family two-component response regulator